MGSWVRVSLVDSSRTATQLGRVTELPTHTGDAYTVFLDDGPLVRLPGPALRCFPKYGDLPDGLGSVE